jgi:hypothetical protein
LGVLTRHVLVGRERGSADPLPAGKGSRSRRRRQQKLAICRELLESTTRPHSLQMCRKKPRDVTGASRVPQMCPECVRVFDGQTTTKCGFAGTLGKPSDGLEPSTPSLPCAPIGNQSQPVATVLACFGRFAAFRFVTGCHWLRPLGSINAPSALRKTPDGKRVSGALQLFVSGIDPFFVERGSSAPAPSCDGATG